MNNLHVYANGDQTTAVAAEMRAEIAKLTVERDEAREQRDYYEAAWVKACAARDFLKRKLRADMED